MRVTEQNKFQALSSRLQSRQAELQGAMAEISTGKRVRSASDDPVAASMADRIAEVGGRHQAWVETAHSVREDHESADLALENASGVLVDARQLAMQLGNDTSSPQRMQDAADAVAGLRDSLRSAANAKHQGRFLFGGVADGAEPFDAAGSYAGSKDTRTVEIGYGVNVSQIAGDRVFSGAGGGQDTFAALTALEDALRAGDADAVRGTIDSLDAGHSQVVAARQRLGHDLDRIDQAVAFSENVVLQGEAETGRLEDADVVDAIQRMNSSMGALQLAAEAASRTRSLDAILKL